MATAAADTPLMLRRSAGDRYGIAIMAALVLCAFAMLAAATAMVAPRSLGFGVFLASLGFGVLLASLGFDLCVARRDGQSEDIR